MKTLGMEKEIETALSSENVFSMFVVLLLLGYFIAERKGLEKMQGSLIVIICTASFLAFCILQFWGFSKEYDYIVAEGYQSIFPVLVAICLFELLQRIKIGEKTRKITEYLSRISFGIYFVHVCIMQGLSYFLNRSDLGYFANFLIMEIVSFGGAVIIIEVTRRIPWIRKNLYVIK